MKLIKIICFSIAAVFFMQTATAAEGQHTLRVGSRSAIWPGQELGIYFDTLNPYMGTGMYDVRCRVYANTFTSIPVTAYMESLGFATVYLNGHMMDMYGDYLFPGVNTLDITYVNSFNGGLYLKNNDWLILGDSFSLYGDCFSSFHY